MEKYGVHTERDQKACRICGRDVVTEGAVLRCPVHGSEPYEKTSTTGVEPVGTGEDQGK